MEKNILKKNAKGRYNNILNMLNDNNDSTGLELLESLVNSVVKYVSHVSRMEHRIKQWKYTMEDKEYMEAITNLDRTRRIYHESLISNLTIMNRYLFKNYTQTPVGGIYSFDPETVRDRNAIADWAGFLYSALNNAAVVTKSKV
ncbi:MAG: DUF3232 domain-containing protein [Candidatus Pacearchaeota archaeon]